MDAVRELTHLENTVTTTIQLPEVRPTLNIFLPSPYAIDNLAAYFLVVHTRIV